MYKIKETIIVEGTYDKIKLSQFIDGVIFVTGGFAVMTNPSKIKAIKSLGEKTGIVILTDSDSAGFRIRNFVKQLLPQDKVKHAYIPDIYGKEKRKKESGKEGLLGVEGLSDEILIKALMDSGCTMEGDMSTPKQNQKITKSDLYALGLTGSKDSKKKREKLSQELGLPKKISANMLLDVINRVLNLDELKKMVQDNM